MERYRKTIIVGGVERVKMLGQKVRGNLGSGWRGKEPTRKKKKNVVREVPRIEPGTCTP